MMFFADPIKGKYDVCIRAERVVYLNKGVYDHSDVTNIHLDTGETIQSWDSIKTLRARIESALKGD